MKRRKKSLFTTLVALVMVVCMAMPTFAANFTDVKDDAWYAGSVERWADASILNGYKDGTFAPDKDITRAELAKVMSTMLGLTEKGDASFADVAEGQWYTDAVLSCANAGVVTGYTDGTFRPDEKVTREQAFTMIMRAVGLEESDAEDAILAAFVDGGKVSNYAKEPFANAIAYKAVNGYKDNTIRPQDQITRAEVAKTLDYLVSIYVDAEGNITKSSLLDEDYNGRIIIVNANQDNVLDIFAEDGVMKVSVVGSDAEPVVVETKAKQDALLVCGSAENGIEILEIEGSGMVVGDGGELKPIGWMGEVSLVSDSVLEIEYWIPVMTDEAAHALFDITIDGEPVEWEYLSYFDFGEYAERGGVVNVQLKEALDVGQPRIQRREVKLFDDTQVVNGPAAAEKIAVKLVTEEEAVTAKWDPFWAEIQRGHMSQVDAWGSVDAGNAEANAFASDGTVQKEYTTDYIVKVVGEGINGMVGRSEYLNLPMIEAGLTVHVLGDEQSVYEDPAYRGLYVCGETEDTYTRTGISGSVEKPIIVTTADEVMRHDSTVDAWGNVVAEEEAPARVNDDYFQLGEDFLKLYYEFGVVEGSLRFPEGYYTEDGTYRYDQMLAEAYEAAKASGLWQGTEMIESIDNYYLYGALIHFEMIPEAADGKWSADRFPINTREELAAYDSDLYEALAGIHGRYHWFTGNNSQSFTRNDFQNDVLKNSHPWFWQSQVDNYTVNVMGISVERPALAIEHVDVISDTQLEVKFNREISTISPAANIKNWKITLDGEDVTDKFSIQGGYVWRTITFRARGITLDNGVPYGKDYKGFTQADLDERSVSNGGWIADTENVSPTALDFGEMVTLEDAIKNGADTAGRIVVQYVGEQDVLDWDGNALSKNAQYQAKFNPWMGTVYRTPLTGVYIYADSVVAPETLVASGHLYDSSLANNTTVVYEKTAGGDDVPADIMASMVAPQNSSDIRSAQRLVDSGFLNSETVTYDRTGQRIADGSVKRGGGMQLIGGYTYSHHAAMQPTHRGQISNGFHVWLYVEGWGGTTFQSDETMVLKNVEMTRYKNENLVYHEGGHGIDSFTIPGAGTYADYVWYDITAAWATAVAYENGRTWWNQYNTEGAYLRNRDEYTSTGSTFYHSTMREQFMGINDGTWTPINTREELYRYDEYGFEVFKRIFYNGELGLYYTDDKGVIQWGNPEYRVIESDWVLLKEQYPERFGHWTSSEDLIAWACTISYIAHDNPYTGQKNEDINWVSWNTPNVWDITQNDNPAVETNTKDFLGGAAYNPVETGSPTENQAHPFISVGVQKPTRPAEIAALVAPVKGKISNAHVTARPVVIEFNFDGGEVTVDNATTSFDLKIDGELTHFYFWDYDAESDTVQIRVEWPIEDGAKIEVTAR